MALGVKFSARVCLRIREWPAGMPRRLLTRGPNANGGGGGARWWPFGSALSSGIPGYFGGGVPAWAGGSSRGSGGASSGASINSGSSSSGTSGSEEEAVPGEWNERHWLRPRSPLGSAPSMDISFDLVDGDFAVRWWCGIGEGLQSRIACGRTACTADTCAAWVYSSGGEAAGVKPGQADVPCAMRPFIWALHLGPLQAFRGLWRMQAASPAACRLSYSLFVRPQPWLPVSRCCLRHRAGRRQGGSPAKRPADTGAFT